MDTNNADPEIKISNYQSVIKSSDGIIKIEEYEVEKNGFSEIKCQLNLSLKNLKPEEVKQVLRALNYCVKEDK